MSLATVYDDAPYYYENGNQVFNWYGGYWGPKTIRYAIMESMNIIAVKCITDVTPQLAYDYLLKLGFTTLVERKTDSDGLILSDINQSLALGGLTNGITNLEITAAYATIANGGNYIKPVFYSEVYDHEGNLLIDNREPEKTRVISEQTAWLLTSAMHDVVTGGTGSGANSYTGMYTAGKTGTTSGDFDNWFCGYNPYYTASIWLGMMRTSHTALVLSSAICGEISWIRSLRRRDLIHRLHLRCRTESYRPLYVRIQDFFHRMDVLP